MSLRLAEKIEEHAIEPELLRAGPRRLRITYWSSMAFLSCICGLGLVGFGILCVGVQSAKMYWLSEKGRTAVAGVTGCTFQDGSIGSCFVHPDKIDQLHYKFVVHNASYTGNVAEDALGSRLDFSGTGADRPDTHPILLVRYLPLGSHLIYAPASSLSTESSEIAMIGAILFGAACLLIAGRWLIGTARLRRLVCYGTPVVGTVRDKTITDDDGPRYFVSVGYMDASGVARQFHERCTPDQWRRLDIGQPVTVLTIGTVNVISAIYCHIPLRCR